MYNKLNNVFSRVRLQCVIGCTIII